MKNNYTVIAVLYLNIFLDSCTLNYVLKSKINYCSDFYSILNQQDQNFNPNWDSYDQNKTTITYSKDYSNVLNAFLYSDSSRYNSYPYVSLISTYLGGGYVFEMQWDTYDEIANNLTFLQSSNWIDRQTKAIFIEFNLYNPNIGLFSYCYILFEILPTGNLIITSNYSPIKLLNIQRPKDVFSTESFLFFSFIIFILVFMVYQFIKMIKLGREFFKRVYSYVNAAVIGLAWAGFAMTVHKLIEMNKIFSDIGKTNDVYINLQYTDGLNDIITNLFAFCTMFCTLRLIKLISFNKIIKIFTQTLKNAFKELLNFGFYFFVFWFCFIQIIYLLLNQVSIQFSTVLRTMESCFQILLGKFKINDILNGDKTLGPILFVLYNIIVVFVLICIFLAILMEYYAAAYKNPNFNEDEQQLYNYFRELIQRYLRVFFKNDEEKTDPNDVFLRLEKGIDRLLEKVTSANKK